MLWRLATPSEWKVRHKISRNLSRCLCMLAGYLLLMHRKICDFNVMSQKMRQAVLDTHNKRRSSLAKGEVRRNMFSQEYAYSNKYALSADYLCNFKSKMGPSTSKHFQTYDCELEKKAAHPRPCKNRPSPTTFNYTGMNCRHIETEIKNFQPIKTPEEAIKEAAREWWDLHMNYTKFKGVTPRVNDFPIITFLIMANAETPKVGCAVDLCRYGNDSNLYTTRKYYAVLCYYTRPHVMVDIPIYKEGLPCEGCPPGYKCDELTKLCKDKNLYFPRYPNPPKPWNLFII